MKRIILISIFCALCGTTVFAQLKVFNNGNVAIGGNNISNSKVQVNIEEGENNGFKVYDKTWGESKFKVNTDESHTYLSGWAHYPNHSM